MCTADGLNVSYVGTGICSLTAHVAAGTDYAAADGTPQTFDVSPAMWPVTVTGDQAYGGSPSFTAVPDSGPTQPYSGTLTCATVNGGTPISSSLAANGGYTIDGVSCSGLSLTGTDASDYTLAYSGSTFTVDQDASAITLQASANPDDSGQPVTFTAAVTARRSGFGHAHRVRHLEHHEPRWRLGGLLVHGIEHDRVHAHRDLLHRARCAGGLGGAVRRDRDLQR